MSGCRHRTAKRYSAGACCRCSSSHPPPPLPPRSPQRSRPAACSSTLASGTPPRALSAPRAEPLICPSLPSHRRVGSSTAAATSHILAATVGGRSTRAPRRTTWLPCPPPQRGASPRGEQRWRACEGGRLEEAPPPPAAAPPPTRLSPCRSCQVLKEMEAQREVAAVTEEARPPSRDNLGVPEAAWLRHEVAHSVAEEVPHRDDAIAVFVDAARAGCRTMSSVAWLAQCSWTVAAACCKSRLQCASLSLTCTRPSSLSGSNSRASSLRATLAVPLRGIETGVEAPRQVGYGCIALFNVLGRREQPKEEAEAPISLNVGAFQLPLLQVAAVRIVPRANSELTPRVSLMQGTAHAVARERGGASELTLSRGPRVPCASLLVRIRAAASADGPAPPYARKIRNPPGPASPEIQNSPPPPQLRKPNIRLQPLHAAATRAAPLPTATTKAAEARAGGDPQGGRRARTQCHCPRGGGRLAVVPHADGGRRPRATRHARLRSIQCDGGRTGGVSPVSPA